ncbi:Hypothetical protein DPCES_5084 [Desulfitobacterium hafniense]|uniref:Uncharacterized protein n=1 Tax=Desulfitobacterium hafniense TaxID=49338 RepID=A0A098B9C0_DESHA|nr:Hypothetical protein DPCES_5084 [Desulfitobacterium hafniense]
MLKIAIRDNEALIADQIASFVKKSLPDINLCRDIFSDPDNLLYCQEEVLLTSEPLLSLEPQLPRLFPAVTTAISLISLMSNICGGLKSCSLMRPRFLSTVLIGKSPKFHSQNL